MVLLSGLVALAFLAQAPVAPAAPPSAPAAVTKAQPDPGDRKVCVTDTDTGSVLPKRTCHTQREWDRIKADALPSVGSSAGVATRSGH